MREVRRILIAGLSGNLGGMETYVRNIYRKLNREKYQLDFLTTDKTLAFSNEFEKMGAQIFYAPKKRDGLTAFRHYVDALFVENRYFAVCWERGGKLTDLTLLKAAKAHGVPVRAVHSHSTRVLHPPLSYRILSGLVSLRLFQYANCLLACSPEAGRWMFGSRPFTVIPNCIETEKFLPDPNRRNQIREEMQVGDRMVLGTVGRLSPAKNLPFLVDLVEELKHRGVSFVFWHLGDGEQRTELEEQIRQRELEDTYILLGNREDIPRWLDGMDLFLLPSLYEGFPMSLVEAQASGLTCLVSDRVTRAVDLCGDMQFLPLEKGADVWAKEIEGSQWKRLRKDNSEVIKAKGYDLEATVRRIEKGLDQLGEVNE